MLESISPSHFSASALHGRITGLAGRIDLQRLEAARSERQKQLAEWNKYDFKMRTTTELVNGPSRPPKESSVKFQEDFVLFDAVLRDDLFEVRSLLLKGVNPNVAKDDGLTPLHQACINDNVELCELLLRFGADVNARDADHWTPLHAAAKCGFVEIAETLISHNANILAINVDGSLPFDLAEDDEMSSFLQDEFTKQGVTREAVEHARSAPENRMLRDILWRYDHGDSVDELDRQGAAPIHVAAACGYLEVARVLFQMGVDPNSLDADGWTPAHVAVFWNQLDMLELLAANGSDFYMKTPDEETVFSLSDNECMQADVMSIWDNREQLRLKHFQRRDSRYVSDMGHKPLQRKRSTSFVHRSSLREKTNYSKREVKHEKEYALNVSPEGVNDTEQSSHPYAVIVDRTMPSSDNFKQQDSDMAEQPFKEKIIHLRLPSSQESLSSKEDSAHSQVAQPNTPDVFPTGSTGSTNRKLTVVDKRSTSRSNSDESLKRNQTTSGEQKSNHTTLPHMQKSTSTLNENDHASITSSTNYSSCCRNCTIL